MTEVKTQVTLQNTQGDAGNTYELLSVPAHIQTSLDSLLGYYADNAKMTDIKLCGNPLDICSELVTRLTETVPQSYSHACKDVLDFTIRETAEFCKTHHINYLTMRFQFDRGVAR